jgi:hypothetical protein
MRKASIEVQMMVVIRTHQGKILKNPILCIPSVKRKINTPTIGLSIPETQEIP